MSTFAESALISFQERWSEIDALVAAARVEQAGTTLHSALCRASVVLISAHLEGFIKAATKAIIEDFNTYCGFSQSPAVLRKNFVGFFVDSKSGAKAEQLESIFASKRAELAHEVFLFDDNKNPHQKMIEKVCRNLGVNNFFQMLHNSTLEDAFLDSSHKLAEIEKDLLSELQKGLSNFPYSLDLARFKILKIRNDKATLSSLWITYLENLLNNRHSIAHGNSFVNGLSHEEIEKMKSKAVILHYAFLLIVASELTAAKV